MAAKEKDWFKARGYLHLDNKIASTDRRNVNRYVSNEKLVANHAFLPLLHKVKIQRRLKSVEGSDKKKNNKETAKERPLHYAGHKDSQIYAYYANVVLARKYEKILSSSSNLDKSVTAYRRIPAEDCPQRNKNNIDFAKEVFDEIKKRGDCVAMAFDIENFFPSLDHQILKDRWSSILETNQLPPDHYNIFKSVTKFRYILLDDFRVNGNNFDEKKLAQFRTKGIRALLESPKELSELTKSKQIIVRKNQRVNKKANRSIGIPQGLPISSILANIYMLPFDQIIVSEMVESLGVFYRRYSDDMVFVCSKGQENFIQKRIAELLSSDIVQLTISEKKTEISFFREENIGNTKRLQVYRYKNGKELYNVPFVYLGFEFYGYQTLIKSAKIAGFYRRMKASIKRKSRMAEKCMDKELLDKKNIYKTRLYRLYSFKGIRSRKLPRKNIQFEKNEFGQYRFVSKEPITRKYRGNTLSYAKRASNIMDEPKILKQYRKHMYILSKELNDKELG